MKCPLTTAIDYEDESVTKFHTADCLKEECAWWDNTNGLCAVLQLSKSIHSTASQIGMIQIEMPKDLAPRG